MGLDVEDKGLGIVRFQGLKMVQANNRGEYQGQFGYRLWDLVNKKVIQSQDIVFMEEKSIVD